MHLMIHIDFLALETILLQLIEKGELREKVVMYSLG